jgi:hypothetical protein
MLSFLAFEVSDEKQRIILNWLCFGGDDEDRVFRRRESQYWYNGTNVSYQFGPLFFSFFKSSHL